MDKDASKNIISLSPNVFKKQMGRLSAAFFRTMTEENLNEYWRELRWMQDDRFIRICDIIIHAEDRFPVIACFYRWYRIKFGQKV